MPREVTDTIDVCRHKRHDLRLTRKVIFIGRAIFGFVLVTILRRRVRSTGGGCDVLAHKSLAI